MARATAVFAVVFTLSSSLLAQSTPPPSGVLIPPLSSYAGRYLDSAQTPQFQGAPTRTLRAQLVKVAPERGLILMKLSGSRFGVYRMDTFASRLNTFSTGGHGEKFVPPDVFTVEPELSSDWFTVLVDGQDRLFDFDYDDRGYFYLAYSVWGLGIVDSTGALQAQVATPAFGVQPLKIIAVPAGGRMYAVISNSSSSDVYDVTVPTAPVFVRPLNFAMVSYAKLAAGGLAIVTNNGDLRVYANGADFVAGNPPAQTFTPQPSNRYVLVTTDGAALFAAQLQQFPTFGTIPSKFDGAPGTFTETLYAPLAGFSPVDLQFGAGYFLLAGSSFPPPTSRSLYLYPRNSSTPINLTPYFSAAYPAGPIGFDSAAAYTVAGRGQSYLIAALFGVGDVFSLGAQAIPTMSTVALLMLAIAAAAIALIRLR